MKSPSPNSNTSSTSSPVPPSSIAAGEAQTLPLAASSSPPHNFVPAAELGTRSVSPSHSDSLMEDDVDMDILKGFPTLNTSETDETQLASAYAAETRNVLGAEAFIAERRYRQMLMVAQSCKRRMLKAKTRFKKASKDVVRFRDLNAVVDNIEQPISQLAAGLV